MSQSSRRSFLGAAAAVPGAAFGAGRAAPNDRAAVALLGCGSRGRGVLKAFLANPGIDCTVVCDVDDRQLAKGVQVVEEARKKTPAAVKDFRRVLERRDVDICIVATPDHWHALPSVLACQAGKDVYLEKPQATTVAESRAVVEAAGRHKRIVQLDAQWKSGGHYKDAVAFVQSGKLGKIRAVRTWCFLEWLPDTGNPPDSNPPAGVDYDMWLGPAPKRPFNPSRFHFNFRWFWDYSGGLQTDWGVHLLNLAAWAMGPDPVRTVASTGGKYVLDDNSETPDTQVTVYGFPKYSLVWEHQRVGGIGLFGRPHGICFTGKDATLILDQKGWEIIPESKKAVLNAETGVLEPRVRGPESRLEAIRHEATPEPTPEHVRDFLDCVVSRREPAMNPVAGHFATTLAHLGNVSLLAGRQITWDATNERVAGDEQANRLLVRPYRAPWKLPYYRGSV